MVDYEKEIMDEVDEELDEEGYTAKRPYGTKRNASKKGKGWAVLFAVAMLAAFITFIVLTVIQDRIVNDKATSPIVVAIAEVPEGIKLTEGNMAMYFAIQERDQEQIPTGITYYDASSLIGQVTGRKIYANEIITPDCFKEETVFDEIEDAVELSLELGNLGQTVSGTLRAGDLVDIIAVIKVEKNESQAIVDLEPGLLDIEYPEGTPPLMTVEPDETDVLPAPGETEEIGDVILVGQDGVTTPELNEEEFDLSYGVTGEYVAQLVAENIRVTGVFTSGGEAYGSTEGGAMVATVINISVPRAYVDAILIALEEGKVTLVKVDEEKELQLQENTSGTATTTPDAAAPTATPAPAETTTVQ